MELKIRRSRASYFRVLYILPVQVHETLFVGNPNEMKYKRHISCLGSPPLVIGGVTRGNINIGLSLRMV